MPALIAQTASVDLVESKTSGLNDLGVPVDANTAVKKGQLREFLQPLESGGIARRYQNIRLLAIKTTELDRLFSKLIVQFEVFADDWTSTEENTGVDFNLMQGEQVLLTLSYKPLFLPYCRFWYENQFERTVPNEVFDALSHLQFVANSDDMQAA